jgi:hypothetical protein
MTIYVPGKVTLRQTWQPMDPDAAAYITAVETADGQALEEKVKIAIDNFVLGCKADGIWSAIKASCILAGARTLNGALVPLVGTAPTNFSFVEGDYDRETGLKGNKATKYISTNRSHAVDPQNSKHVSTYISEEQTNNSAFIGIPPANVPGDLYLYYSPSANFMNVRINSGGTLNISPLLLLSGLTGANRASNTGFTVRANGINYQVSDTSSSPLDESIDLFRSGNQYSDARLAFYSIGEALDLALLDARVSTLMSDLAAAIP